MIEIVDAKWTPQVNMYIMRCGRGHTWEHRSDRWWARCPICNEAGHTHKIRCNAVGDYDEQRIQEEIEILKANIRKRRV